MSDGNKEYKFTLEDVYDIQSKCFAALASALEAKGALTFEEFSLALREQLDVDTPAPVAAHITGFADALDNS